MDVRSNSLNTVKTDLRLLLECLKFQMKCPDLQKQALLTIYSICEKREDIVDLLREMGGVVFVYNLSKSSIVHSDVKQTALFTLGTLAETSVYCKTSLCRKETFSDLAHWLMKEDTPLTQRRVAVYLLSVLVANNKSGQTYAQTTGCMDLLLDLFRTSFPLSTETTLKPVNATQTYQLWTSVSSALCGCVNNPQNEEGQRICVVAFPMVKTWLQQITLPRAEIFQPVCSFIAMTVSNNSCAQESFSASGGLETLTLALVRLASDAEKSLVSCQLSVILTKTLSACITDNSVLATGLAQYGLVPQLLSLLSSPNLDPQDRLSVVLTLGHCTEASEEHQSQLVQCGGLPPIITLLTESTSVELRKAATFILQTCKQATMSLGAPGLRVTQDEVGTVESLTNMEGYWSSARELLHRINQLEERQEKETEYKRGDVGSPTPTKELGPPSLPPALRGDTSEVWLRGGKMTNERWSEEGRMGLKGGEKKSENHRELTPVSSLEPRRCTEDRIVRGCSGGREGCEGQWRKSIPLPDLERRGREDMRGERNRRENIQHKDRALHLLVGDRVRRQIFKDSTKTQKSALASRVQQERRHSAHTHQTDSNERVHTVYRQANSPIAGDDGDIDLHTLGRAQRTKMDSNRELKNGSSNSSTQGEKAKNTQCSQAEHYQVPEQQNNSNTLSVHSGVGVTGQAPDRGDVLCSVCKGTRTHVIPLEGAREPQKADSQVFIPPAPVKDRVPKDKKSIDDEDALPLCSELLDNEISKTVKPPVLVHTPPHDRCSGCMLRFEEVTSRTFASLQSSCHHSCDMHKVLQEATERFRARHHDPPVRKECQEYTVEQIDPHSETTSDAEPQGSRQHWRKVCLTPIRKGAGQLVSSLPVKHLRKNHNGITLTPLCKRAEMKRFTSHDRKGLGLTTLKKPYLPEERRIHLNNGDRQPKTQPSREPCSTQRKRKDFTHDEVCYLLSGVKTYGFSWNSILWSYPFQPGRTNVGLAKKYRQLMKTKAKDLGCT